MFDKILIANRGEIACRVIRTARRLGVRTTAVYSEADADSPHVRAANEAYPIGPAPAADSYLRGDLIIEVARQVGAQAIHPGYGFLSENADFAQACRDIGLVFIGPPAPAIRAMGSKTEAKQLMEQAGVPVVPGYHQDNLDLKVITTKARIIGYPVLIKASAGGGGRGMRVVASELDLAESIASARREAQAAFGDDHILLEKFIARPRHIEVQIFADGHGHVVHMFERDCSIQRRHQKIIEEAPAPGLTEDLRQVMGATAVAAAHAVGYVGAGTVEFILDRDDNYYFIEMNTRLQVEHPVTEAITGRDLVEWQLRIAAGEPLPRDQEQLTMEGHAIEARIYAEDPSRDFLPSSGRLDHLRFPTGRPELRVETGVGLGDTVSPHYDPMIAKLVVWGVDRDAAVRGLRRALAETQIAGPATNRAFLAAVAGHPSFAAADCDTGFIDRHFDDLVPAPRPAPELVVALAALHLLESRKRQAANTAQPGDPYSPWSLTGGWRLSDNSGETVTVIDGNTEITVPARGDGDGYLLTLPDGETRVSARAGAEPGDLAADLGGIRVAATVIGVEGGLMVWLHGTGYHLRVPDPEAHSTVTDSAGGHLTAPMPGRIVQVLVEDGAEVTRGAALIVLEAMKMEHTIAAPDAGTVVKVNYAVDEWVEEGVTLLDFTPRA